jgi:hypothetical protein
MTSKPFDLVAFAATGDLAMRKLPPALRHRHEEMQDSGASRMKTFLVFKAISDKRREQGATPSKPCPPAIQGSSTSSASIARGSWCKESWA